MEQTTAPARIVYILDSEHYFIWSPEERLAVERWLLENGIEPKDVRVGRDAPQISIRRLEDGSDELTVWVMDRNEDGKTPNCPHCPSCPRQTRVTKTPVNGRRPVVQVGMWREDAS